MGVICASNNSDFLLPRKSKLAFVAVLCILEALATTAQQSHPDAPHQWTYAGDSGPQNWADLTPEFATCGTGKIQSPINITGARGGSLPDIRFSYKDSPLALIDNGHSIQGNYAPGSTISIGGKTYELVQFHFHHPSEEAVDGNSFAMSVHLVHRNKNGELAVIAILLRAGTSNRLIDTIWNHIPAERDMAFTSGTTINLLDLLPADRRYYTYQGSLTTPPCTEGVTWYVLQTPVTVSQSQIEQFAKLYPMNARPTQPLNGRIVMSSRP